MRGMHSKIISAAAVAFLVSWNCYAQVYSAGVYSGGVTGWGGHYVGADKFRFGYSEYSYSTDARGFIIMISPGRGTQPGDTFHRRTEIYLGPASFSVPMRPLPFLLVVVFGSLTALALGDFGWRQGCRPVV